MIGFYGQSGPSTNNSHGAVFAALFIIAGSAPVSFLFSARVGYLIAGMFVLALAAAGGVYRSGIFRDWSPAAMATLTLFGAYYLVLVLQFFVTLERATLPYLFLTPLVFVAFVGVAPPLIEVHREAFTAIVALIGAVMVALGFVFLVLWLLGGESLGMTGRLLFGEFRFRISSIYNNSNSLGFVAGLATLSALYLYLQVGARRWALVGTLLFVGLLFSNSRMAMLTFLAVGVVFAVLQLNPDGLGTSTLSTGYIATLIGVSVLMSVFFFLVSDFLAHAVVSLQRRLDMWSAATASITSSPLIGEGFTGKTSTHNSYLSIFVNSGVIGGVCYSLGLVVAGFTALRRALSGSLWDHYVLTSLAFVYLTLLTETATLGGLSIASLALALFIGLGISRPDQ